MNDVLRETMYKHRATVLAAKATAKQKPTTDPVQAAPATAGFTLDSAAVQSLTLGAAAAFDTQLITKMALSVVGEWAGTDDLDAGESSADRLMGMIVGISDENHDGEITDDEQDVIDVALSAVYDYLLTLGVTEADAEDLLSNWGAEVGDRVREQVALALPSGEEAEDKAVEALTFTPADQEPVFDSVSMDAAYRKVVAIRGGKRVRINKRIAGVVRLSSKQKVALRKARSKAFSAGAMARRAKSARMRKSMGMGA